MLSTNFRCICTRGFHGTAAVAKMSLKDVKGRSKSSQEWLTRQLNDRYVKMAQTQNYRARSAFKLIEIDTKYGILKPGHLVIDCGAAPGAWTQVAVQRSNAEGKDATQPTGQVISVDLQYFEPINGAAIIDHSDFTLQSTQELILETMHKDYVDVILSDMAPNASGLQSLDHENIMELCRAAFTFATQVLRNNGVFLCKLWEGGQSGKFKKDLTNTFKTVKIVKPDSSRQDSSEIFFLARGFKKSSV